MRAAALELDTVLGDTRPLWQSWLEDAARRLRLELADLPEDRLAAATLLDERVRNWRQLLERYAAEHAPVHLRADSGTNARLRALQQAGVRLGAFTDAPVELAQAALVQLGAARRIETVGTLEHVHAALGADVVVVRSRSELARLS